VAVGGTDFNDRGTESTYFNTGANPNDPTTLASAKSYIPETTWNDSCTKCGVWINPEDELQQHGGSKYGSSGHTRGLAVEESLYYTKWYNSC